ncbi:hypothetical protein [Pelomonas sp. SE-A7]|uniref:hypothetical protein n=1 Tax=Pelomonas sp. SE-A7 TaxID=3054953 RepID=UPI00259CEE45|nr:hypothetical protein [Pelomonas sp. SE-A7]MDM4765979.1 hypothetical protein [Pelomonas sp. SE-A7]
MDMGELSSTGEGAWLLNPKSPLPLTVVGADRVTAARLKDLLGRAEYWTQKVPEVALLIAQHNLQFKELDAFVAQHKRRFDADVEQRIASSSEWAAASAKDRADLRSEFEDAAEEALGIFVGRADLGLLLHGQPAAFADDDELLKLFNGDATLYSFYLSQLGRANPVVTVKAEDYGRKSWEQLVEKGMAQRGKDIPLQLLLEGLKLKELNDILADVVGKPLGRKAKAVEVAVALPDLHDRLSQRIAFREMFQALPPADLDVAGLVGSFAYASSVATVVQQTYFTAVQTLEAIEERKRDSGIYDAWEISNWEDPLPACAAAVCKKYDRLPAKRPPFHVGCNCRLACSFKD